MLAVRARAVIDGRLAPSVDDVITWRCPFFVTEWPEFCRARRRHHYGKYH